MALRVANKKLFKQEQWLGCPWSTMSYTSRSIVQSTTPWCCQTAFLPLGSFSARLTMFNVCSRFFFPKQCAVHGACGCFDGMCWGPAFDHVIHPRDWPNSQQKGIQTAGGQHQVASPSSHSRVDCSLFHLGS